ncbi:hypothetical protein D3C81_1275400 [compost metagenome]
MVKGGLREDEFNGGYALRIRQCWDYEQLCADHALRLSLRVDGRGGPAWQRIDALLAGARPGRTPLRLDLLLNGKPSGSIAGMLDLGGPGAVRVSKQLLDALREDPAVRRVKVKYSPPWAN